MTELLDMDLDPERSKAKKQQRLRRFHRVDLPRLRLLGFFLLFLGAILHNRVVFGEFDHEAMTLLGLILGSYSFFAWAMLNRFYGHLGRIDLGDVFLIADLLPIVITISFTGGERSLFFLLLIVRPADQINRGFKRALFFTHLSTFAYALFIFYAGWIAHHPLSLGLELAKVTLIYGVGLYLSLIARMAEDMQSRMTQAIHLSRNLIQELEREKLNAQAANLAKSQFLTNMSHELRTPLNSIIGFARVLLSNKNLGLSNKALTYTERIFANGRHLLDLINEILDLSKIETGHSEAYFEEVDLESLIQSTVEQLEGHLKNPRLKLQFELPHFIAPLHTDAQKLKQVLINLIGNALKFTEEGSVTVAVLTDPSTRQALRIEVRDTGTGISTHELEKIFEPFHQLDNSTTRRHGGTGLGLAISRALLDVLDYSLKVESQEGQGSTFAILLTPPLKLSDSSISTTSDQLFGDENQA